MNFIDSFCFAETKRPVMSEFKKIAEREGMSKSEILVELIEEYVKNHAEGNSSFKITDFEDPNFRAMPATMSDTGKWNEYIRKHMDRKERDELYKQIDYMKMLIK